MLRDAKRLGFADAHLDRLLNSVAVKRRCNRIADRCARRSGLTATFHRVDTCAAEFYARTPYMYSGYESQDEADPTDRRKDPDPG